MATRRQDTCWEPRSSFIIYKSSFPIIGKRKGYETPAVVLDGGLERRRRGSRRAPTSLRSPELETIMLIFLLLLQALHIAVPARSGVVSQYSHGMSLARSGHLDEALGYLRAAVRENPDNALYLNDLGVAEMRLGLLHRARDRFLASLRANASFDVAQDNLRELEAFLVQERHENKATWDPAKRTLHALQPLPRLSVEDLDWPWSAEYRTLQEPFILMGAMRGWDFSELNMLAESFPDARVDFYPHSLRTADAKPLFLTLKEGHEEVYKSTGVFHDIDASEKGTYLQWNLDFEQWKNISALIDLPPIFRDPFDWLEECFRGDDAKTDFFIKTHWMMVLIGEEGSGMFNHRDTLRTGSWQAQVQGVKRWHLCSPAQSEFMYSAGEVDMFGPPNYVRHPKTGQASCYQDDLMPGEMLFYPNDYWHQTKNLETPTVSVSGSLMTPLNHELVLAELEKECAGEARIFLADEVLCGNIRRCKQVWKRFMTGRMKTDEEENVLPDSGDAEPAEGAAEEGAAEQSAAGGSREDGVVVTEKEAEQKVKLPSMSPKWSATQEGLALQQDVRASAPLVLPSQEVETSAPPAQASATDKAEEEEEEQKEEAAVVVSPEEAYEDRSPESVDDSEEGGMALADEVGASPDVVSAGEELQSQLVEEQPWREDGREEEGEETPPQTLSWRSRQDVDEAEEPTVYAMETSGGDVQGEEEAVRQQEEEDEERVTSFASGWEEEEEMEGSASIPQHAHPQESDSQRLIVIDVGEGTVEGAGAVNVSSTLREHEAEDDAELVMGAERVAGAQASSQQ